MSLYEQEGFEPKPNSSLVPNPSLVPDMNSLTPYPITPIGNFIGVVLVLLPLISQIRKLSLAIWGYAIWVALFCFQMFVNSIIWHDNVNIVAPVWCDIGESVYRHSELY